MSETVFILGAGASAETGAPVMATFLDEARQLYLAGRVSADFKDDFAIVFKAIASLGTVAEKATIDTDNLEAVFAAFEMGQLFERFPRFDRDDLERLPGSLRRVIVETLERTIELHISSRSGQDVSLDPPGAYGDFVWAFQDRVRLQENVTLVTFNYDIALDYALANAGIEIDYGFHEAKSPGAVRLLKLHGSVNWTACENCGIAALPISEHLPAQKSFGGVAVEDGTCGRLRVAHLLREFPHCNATEKSDGTPLLVPPTWSKGEHYRRLSMIWRHAARELATARNVIVIGYSLPESDAFFRYLYALGTVSDTRIERFWVFDGAPAEVEGRFRELLGQTVRRRFKVFPYRFGEVIGPPGSLLRSFIKSHC